MSPAKQKKKCTAQNPYVPHFGSLTIFFTIMVFCIIMISTVIAAVILLILYHTGATLPLKKDSGITMTIINTAFLSVIIGTVFAYITSRIPLKPIRRVIAGLNALADGKYETRLSFTRLALSNELSNSFNSLAEELGNTEMLRSDFINNFSHEFKTPIVSIRGFARLMKSNDLTEEERNEYLDIIISEANRLTVLATNVLNLTKIENQAILTGISTFNLSEQLRNCILMLDSKWEKKNIELEAIFPELYYTGNQELLSQVWINILDNAIKFSPVDGHIIIAAEKIANNLKVEITDFGCGMTEEIAGRMFDKFYQGDTSHTSEGNGVGLAVVKKIIDLHKGTITVNSQPEHGTCIKISLPQLTEND